MTSSAPAAAVDEADVFDRLDRQDEKLRRLEVTLRALARFADADGGADPTRAVMVSTDTKLMSQAATPTAIPWPTRTVPPPPAAVPPAARVPAAADLDLLRTALEASPAALVAVDAGGLVRVWNAAATRLFGWAAHEVVGHAPPFVPDDKFDEHTGLFRAAVRFGPIRDLATERRHKDGFLVPVAASVAPSPCGGAVFALVSTAEIPAEPPATEPVADVGWVPDADLDPPDPAAGAAFVTLGRAAAGVAHDFNNLLSVIQGQAEMAAERVPASTELRDAMAAITTAAGIAAGMASQMVSLARPTPEALYRTDANHLLGRLDRLVRAVVGGRVRLVLAPAPTPTPAKVSPSELAQVLLNLASNAREAMPDGGTLTVRTGVVPVAADRRGWPASVPPGEFVVLTVGDNGSGMDDATRARAFEPFFSTKQADRGLGLMIVRDVVTRVGGHVEVDSAAGRGTVVRVYFPRA